MKKRTIPAAGYLRKSTDVNTKDGGKTQARSIPQQKREIKALARREGFKIVEWYADPGVSGWKRGRQRPDFNRMLETAQEGKFQAILCDNIDRFSRAEVGEVQHDAYQLRQAGVRWIVSAAQGTYDLGAGNDIGEIIKFVIAAYSSHEFSRQLGRRIARNRAHLAEQGKRSGGEAPYGYANDGAGGLKLGSRQEVKTVRWIFNQFVNEQRSMNSIAGDLNKRGVMTRRGKKWYVQRIKELLQRRVYQGDFVYNEKKTGQFFIIDKDHNVVEAPKDDPARTWKKTSDGLYVTEGTHEPIISRELFAKAQKRLASFSHTNTRPRRNGFALSGLLYCDHCGARLYGCTPRPGRPPVYRCPSNAKKGAGSCGSYEIKEHVVLPFVVELVGQEFATLEMPAALPPEQRQENSKALEQEIAEVQRKIDNAANALIDKGGDQRTLELIQNKLDALWKEKDKLEIELEAQREDAELPKLTQEVQQWFRNFRDSAIRIPIPKEGDALSAARKSARKTWQSVQRVVASPLKPNAAGQYELKVTPAAFRETLLSLGCEARVRWETIEQASGSGSTRTRHLPAEITLKLGQSSASFCPVPVAEQDKALQHALRTLGSKRGKGQRAKLL